LKTVKEFVTQLKERPDQVEWHPCSIGIKGSMVSDVPKNIWHIFQNLRCIAG
jgi:hypothetical protein